MRKIIHLDMDAFYASVEQRDDPALKGLPIAVGYNEARGVVMTASYEARRFGVGSAMPARMALERCPQLIFVKPRKEVYKAISQHIRKIFHRYTDLVEPLALDEAYLDVTEPKQGPKSATLLAQSLKKDIASELRLTASAGVSASKFLAKIASSLQKPDGLTVIKPEEALPFIAQLPVEKFFGVGPKTAERLHALGIYTGQDLRNQSQERLVEQFGKNGLLFWQMAQGIDDRPVEPNREYKSISAETTFSSDLSEVTRLIEELPPLAEHVATSLRKEGLSASGISVKLKDSHHQIMTRQQSLPRAIDSYEEILLEAERLLRTKVRLELPVRLLGIGVFKLADRSELFVEQPALFN
ncbi:MAG: DNA polymerase IV [Trueperaceae bacterium]|nr:DNA polymerase IV [Trueperaceae bacterium]